MVIVKSASQYDGMKPMLRYKGLTDSDFIPMIHGKPFKDLQHYVEYKSRSHCKRKC